MVHSQDTEPLGKTAPTRILVVLTWAVVLGGLVLAFFAIHPPVEFAIGSAKLKAGGFRSTPRIFLGLWLAWVLVRRNVEGSAFPVATRLQRVTTSLSLFAAYFAVYVANDIVPVGQGDCMPARWMSVALLEHGTITYDWFLQEGTLRPYWLQRVDGQLLSAFPLGTGFLVLPVQGLAAFVSPTFAEPMYMAYLAKTCSAAIAAGAIVVFFWVAAGYATHHRALWLTALLAFGTPLWALASQDLWQHGASTLCLVTALLFATREEKDSGWVRGIPAVIVFALFCRPLNVLWAFPLACWMLAKRPRQLLEGAAIALPLAAAVGWLHLHYYGHVLGPYSGHSSGGSWQTPLLSGLAGHLVSPSRGILVYAPFITFAALGCGMGIRQAAWRPLCLMALASIVAYLVVISKFTHWWGGHCYGPRFQTELMPLYVLMLGPALDTLARSRWLRAIVLVTIAWSVGLQGIGAFSRAAQTWPAKHDIDHHPELLWSIRYPQWAAWSAQD